MLVMFALANVETGFNRLHTVGLIVPLIAFPFLPYLMGINGFFITEGPQVLNALIFGLTSMLVSYILMMSFRIFYEDAALERSVILGLLVAVFTMFSTQDIFPSITFILFFLLSYHYAMGEVDENAHWINSVKGAQFQAVTHE